MEANNGMCSKEEEMAVSAKYCSVVKLERTETDIVFGKAESLVTDLFEGHFSKFNEHLITVG